MSKLSIGFNLNTEARNIALKNALFQDINNSNYYFPNELFRIIGNFQKNLNIIKGVLNKDEEIYSSNLIRFIFEFNFDLIKNSIDMSQYNFIKLFQLQAKRYKLPKNKNYKYCVYRFNGQFKIFVGEYKSEGTILKNTKFNNEINERALTEREIGYDSGDVNGTSYWTTVKYYTDSKTPITYDNVSRLNSVDTLNYQAARGEEDPEYKPQEDLPDVATKRDDGVLNLYFFLEDYLFSREEDFRNLERLYEKEISEITEYYKTLFKNVTVTTTQDKFRRIPEYWSILFQTTFKEYPRCFNLIEYNNDNLFAIYKIMQEKDLIKEFDKLISTSLQFDKLNY